MQNDDPRPAKARVWGASLTIAAIVLGLYLISLFYTSVIDEASHLGDETEQAQMLSQP